MKALSKIIDTYEDAGADIRFYKMNPQTIAASHTLLGNNVMQFPMSIVL